MTETKEPTPENSASDRQSIDNSNWLKEPIRITEQNWPADTKPLVSIDCLTYNHEAFLREAIEGFLMQETTFPVEILIHDDASTDRTAEIVREFEAKYPHLIKPIYQTENQYAKGNIMKCNLSRAKGDFIAVCNGDDWWTSPKKLETQIGYLLSNPHVAGCFHEFQSVTAETSPIPVSDCPEASCNWQTVSTTELIMSNRFGASTAVFRRAVSDDTRNDLFHRLAIGDWPM